MLILDRQLVEALIARDTNWHLLAPCFSNNMGGSNAVAMFRSLAAPLSELFRVETTCSLVVMTETKPRHLIKHNELCNTIINKSMYTMRIAKIGKRGERMGSIASSHLPRLRTVKTDRFHMGVVIRSTKETSIQEKNG